MEAAQTDGADLVRAESLVKEFTVRRGFVRGERHTLRAVDRVSFTVRRGETVALVGESGSGKTTTGRLLLRLLEPSAGRVVFEGKDLAALDGPALRRLRPRMQIVFQDTTASLNPRKTVLQILAQPYRVHGIADRREVRERVDGLLARVGLTPPARYSDRYPHEFSGGQRQRIGIARAIAFAPSFIVADEPVSALDMSVRAQILTLLKGLQREMGLSYLFITHDLAVVRSVSQRVLVMYLGQIVEEAPVAQIFARPLHPYTQALLAATPIPNPRRARERQRLLLPGEPPSPLAPPPGCRFHTRCPFVMPVCSREEPPLVPIEGNRQVACHLYPSQGTPSRS